MAVKNPSRVREPLQARSTNFEFYSWFFMRVSGVLLVLLALGHFAIMHVIFGVEKVNFNFVANRWATPLWRTYDLTLLFVALLHGFNGIRILIDDYIHAKGWRMLSLSALYTIVFIFLALGALVILTFQVPPGVKVR